MRYDEIYTIAQWREEMEVLLSEQKHPNHSQGLGVCTLQCPWCRLYGFYGPRESPGRKYRACKFCGIFQNVGGELEQTRIMICLNCMTMEFRLPTSADGECCGKMMMETSLPIKYAHRRYVDIKQEVYAAHGYPQVMV